MGMSGDDNEYVYEFWRISGRAIVNTYKRSPMNREEVG